MRALRDTLRAATGGLSPVFWVIWTGTLVNRLASFVGPFLALYLVQLRGFDAAAAGSVVALIGLGGLVGAPVAGVLADRLGRRATMVLGLAVPAVATLGLVGARSHEVVVALVLVFGSFHQLYHPASSAAVADVVPSPDRARALGLIYWAMNLGLTVGFAAGGPLAARSLHALFVADACTSALCAALIAWKVPETRVPGAGRDPILRGLARVFADGPYVTFLALHVAALVLFTQFQLALPLDMAAHGQGPGRFSLLMAFNCAGVVVLQPWLTPALRRFDGAHLLAIASVLFGVGYGLNAVSGSYPMYLLGAAFWTVGEVVGFPVAAALVADLAPPELRGRYQGAFSLVWALAMTLSPALGGAVTARFGARTLWVGCLVAGLVLAVLHLAVAGPRRRRLAASAGAAATGVTS